MALLTIIFWDFTVCVPFNIDLTECKWVYRIVRYTFYPKKNAWQNMYICCDVIGLSFVNDKTLPVLRFIPEKEGRYSKSFDTIHYKDAVCKTLNKIRIYIYISNITMLRHFLVKLCIVHFI